MPAGPTISTVCGEPPSSAVNAASIASSSAVRPTKRDEKGKYDPQTPNPSLARIAHQKRLKSHP